MATTTWDIESIVREVLQRLRDGAEVTPGAAPSTPTDPAPRPQPAGAGELAVSDQVVSLAALDGRLAGIRRLVTQPGAVITPSVRDELRERRIELVRGRDVPSGQKPPGQVVLAIIGRAGDANGLVDSLASQVGRVDRFPVGDLLPAVRGIAEQVTARGVPGVLLTDEATAAVCLANRIDGVRAAWAVDRRTVQQAVNSIGANLLVLTPRQGGAADTRALVEQFAAAGSPACPSPFLALLERVR